MKLELYDELVKNLSQLVLVYRHLLLSVRREKQILLRAELQALSESNIAKEALVARVKDLEDKWMGTADKLCKNLGLEESTPRLSEIAGRFEGAQREKLMQLQSVLNLLIRRTTSINKQNDVLIQSALTHIGGAMKSIRDTLSKNSTYEKKGTRSDAPTETSGRLVSKEA